MPRFDSPSIFGAILDRSKGGTLQAVPCDGAVYRLRYQPEINVLMTRFLRPDGVAEVVDFMPVDKEDRYSEIVRIVRGVRGTKRLLMECSPAFDYAGAEHKIETRLWGAVLCSGHGCISLSSPIPVEVREGAAWAEFAVHPRESFIFSLRYLDDAQPAPGGMSRWMGNDRGTRPRGSGGSE